MLRAPALETRKHATCAQHTLLSWHALPHASVFVGALGTATKPLSASARNGWGERGVRNGSGD